MCITAGSATRMAAGVVEMEFRGLVFSGEVVETVSVRVYEDGEDGIVRVWDESRDVWTRRHHISARNLRAIRAAAKD